MDGKNPLLITLGIVAIIVAALLTSFGRSLFFTTIPSVTLPDISDIEDSTSADTNWEGGNSSLSPVTVTVDSVQDVVASLQRTDSYFRELTIELFWGEESSQSSVLVWCNGDWLVTQQSSPNGLVRYDLVGNSWRYYWYSGDNHHLITPADDDTADLSQRIPTYEDVIALDSSDITAASYTTYLGLPAIHVVVEYSKDNRVEEYWIGAENGLLIGAEISVDGQLIYRCTGDGSIQTPCPNDAPFSLPDGTGIEDLE